MQEPNINTGKPWSDVDDDDLRAEIAAGETVDLAATVLCRTPDEVMARAAVLGLRWPDSKNSPKGSM
jgi:hypothetical protein